MTAAARRRAAVVWLAAAGIAVLAAAGARGLAGRAAAPAARAEGPMLPQAREALAATAAIRVTLKTGAYRLVRAGDGWIAPERGDYPVRAEAIGRLARALTAMTKEERRTGDPVRRARLGLGDPRTGGDGALVDLLDGHGRVRLSVIVGVRPSGVYARLPGEDAGYRVRAEGLPPLQNPAAWLDLDVLDVADDDVMRVDVAPADGPAYALVRTHEGFRLADAPADAALSGVNVQAVALAATTWRPTDVAPADAVDGVTVARHRTRTRQGLIVTLTALDVAGRTYVRVAAEAAAPAAAPAAAAVSARAEGWAFALSAYDAADLRFQRADLLR